MKFVLSNPAIFEQVKKLTICFQWTLSTVNSTTAEQWKTWFDSNHLERKCDDEIAKWAKDPSHQPITLFPALSFIRCFNLIFIVPQLSWTVWSRFGAVMSKKQASILSYFKPKSVAPVTGTGVTNPKKKKSVKYPNLDFIFLSSDSDGDDDEIEVLEPTVQAKKLSSDLKPLETESNYCPDFFGDEFCDTEPFLSVTFHEGQEEMVTDSLEVAVDDLFQKDDYKWNNFRAMIDWVLKDRDNEHLFNEEDWSIIQSFTSLSINCQRLYVRLFVRRRNWIRPSRMNYPDLGSDLQPLIDELVKSKFLSNCKCNYINYFVPQSCLMIRTHVFHRWSDNWPSRRSWVAQSFRAQIIVKSPERDCWRM